MRIVITFQDRGDSSYYDLISMAFKSAEKFGYKPILVTNKTKKFDIFLSEKAAPLLMNWVLAAQHAFIESSLFDEPSVIFSPDALILKPLDSIFEQNFDIAFTDRKNSRWPINNGVIYLKPERKIQIAAFWKKAMEICLEYPKKTQEWYGDQQSLHDVYKMDIHSVLGLKVALLPCSIYNASPLKHYRNDQIDRNLLESAYIAHFKGKRKEAMKVYWDHLCTRP